jgi:hypothetical protein
MFADTSDLNDAGDGVVVGHLRWTWEEVSRPTRGTGGPAIFRK